MKKTFSNSSKVQCTFTDEGVIFGGVDGEVYFPYGCIESLKLSLFGVLQAACGKTICSFAVDRQDRAEVKDLVKFAHEAMRTAPKEELQKIDLNKSPAAGRVSADLPPEEQLKQYKALFVQGVITKAEYDARKRKLQGN